MKNGWCFEWSIWNTLTDDMSLSQDRSEFHRSQIKIIETCRIVSKIFSSYHNLIQIYSVFNAIQCGPLLFIVASTSPQYVMVYDEKAAPEK